LTTPGATLTSDIAFEVIKVI